MRTTALLLLLACSAPLSPGPDAGGGGAGGGGGSTGGGSTGGGSTGGGGTGGSLGSCTGQADLIEACVIAPDGGLATETFTATLAVAEVSDVDGGRCRLLEGQSGSTSTAKRVVETATDKIDLGSCDLPAHFSMAGVRTP